MYGKTKLIKEIKLNDGSHEICDFECLNCGARLKKEYRYRSKLHRCPSYRVVNGNSEKWCFKCLSWLEVNFFQKAKHVQGGYAKTCRNCRQMYMRKAEDSRKLKSRKFYETTNQLPSIKLRSMLSAAQHRANKHNLDFNLDIEYLAKLWNDQNGKCFYTNLPMKWAKDRVSFWSPSLDKLDPTKGYTKNNVVLTLFAVNSFKQEMKASDFIKFVNDIDWRKTLSF